MGGGFRTIPFNSLNERFIDDEDTGEFKPMTYEIGVVTSGPLKAAWLEVLRVFRSYRYMKKQGWQPNDKWYGVYEKGSEVVVASCGNGPMAKQTCELIIKAINPNKITK